MHDLLYLTIRYYSMGEAEAFRFREPETVDDLVDKAILTSTKYKNKWAVTVFTE